MCARVIYNRILTVEGSDPQPGTFECVFVHLCGCPLLLWTLQAVVIAEALTA